ncbi:MAG: Response regulator [Bacteroidetes bacterium]|jgi:DNA-binding NarL/FixJ family response regulator|nr:Response regulator [Bacteroidota bacterium]
MPITVAVVEDNADYRLGTAFILRNSSGCSCIGMYETAEELIEAFDDIRPDVVLMDIGLPGMSGIQATAYLKKEHPRVEIIILSVYEDDDNVFHAICAGASGYVTKTVMPQQLLEAVEQAFGGGTPMSPHIARKVLQMFKQHVPPAKADYNLTERECEVLRLLTLGDDYKQIADKLFLSVFTIRAHIRNIYDKLHVHSKSQAVATALKERIVPSR